MRVDDQTKVTNTIAAAIEYLGKPSGSSLAALVRPTLISELRGAITIVTKAAKRELETMSTADLEHLTKYALCVLSARRSDEPGVYYVGPNEDTFVGLARDLAKGPIGDPRFPTAASTRCGHCEILIDGATAPITDVVQIEPVAKNWAGGNFYVRVLLQTCADKPERAQWAPLVLCQQCFEYVASAVARSLVIYGDQARRRDLEDGG